MMRSYDEFIKVAFVYAGGGRVGVNQNEYARLGEDNALAQAFHSGKRKDIKAYEAVTGQKAKKLSRRQFDKQRLNFILDSRERFVNEGKTEGDAVNPESPFFVSKTSKRGDKRTERNLSRISKTK